MSESSGERAAARIIPAVIFLLAAAVYTLCLSPNWGAVSEFNTWDGLEYTLCAATLGIDHPPGHPTYLLICRLAMLWPGASPARVMTMVSALAGALALVFLYYGLLGVMRRQESPPPAWWCRAAAAALALGFGLSYVYWSHCEIVEVHTLLIAVLAGMVAGALKWERTGRLLWLNLAALLAALGIGVNMLATIAVLPPFALFVLTAAGRAGVRRRRLVIPLIIVLLGFLSYLYYPLLLPRASFSHPMNLMAPHPFGSAAWYRWYISGAAWTGGTMFFLERIGFNLGIYTRFIRANLGLIFFLIAVVGAVRLIASAARPRAGGGRGAAAGLPLCLFLISLFLFIAVPELSIHDPSNPRATDYLANFFLPSLLVLFYWAAAGLAALHAAAFRRGGQKTGAAAEAVAAACIVVFPAWQFARNVAACNLSSRQEAYLEAREGVVETPPGSLVLSKLVYPQAVEYFSVIEPVVRPGDIEVVNPDVEAARIARERTRGKCAALFARKNRALLSLITEARESGREVFIAGDAVESDKAPEKLLLADIEFEPRGPFPKIPGAPRELNLYRVTGFRSAVRVKGTPAVADRGIANDGAFADGVRLVGYATPPSVRWEHGGLRLDLDLVWEAARPVAGELYAVATVIDERMRPVPGAAAWYTLGGRFPPSRWEPGKPVEERVSCLLPPIRPGRYFLALGLVDCDDRRVKYVPAAAAAGGRSYEYVLAAPLPVPPPPLINH